MGWLWTVITAIIAGLIIGALARAVLPGKQNISIPVTIGLGILGSLGGSALWKAIGGSDTRGVDWIAFFFGIVIAAVLIVIYERIFSSRGRTRV